MSVSPTDDDDYCVHHSCCNRSSFQAAFLMMANEMKLICERKDRKLKRERRLSCCGVEMRKDPVASKTSTMLRTETKRLLPTNQEVVSSQRKWAAEFRTVFRPVLFALIGSALVFYLFLVSHTFLHICYILMCVFQFWGTLSYLRA